MKKKHYIIIAIIVAALLLLWYFWDNITGSKITTTADKDAVRSLIDRYSKLSNQRSTSNNNTTLQSISDKLNSYGITIVPHGSTPPSKRIFCCTSAGGDIYVGTWYGIWGGCRRVPGCTGS